MRDERTMDDMVNFLFGVSIFSLVGREDLKRIAGLARSHQYYGGDIIIREGDRDNRLFILVEGEVEVIKGLGGKWERSIRALGPGSYFGEMALIDDLLRSASVVARGDVAVLSLTREHFRKVIDRYPAVAFDVLQMMSRRIRTIEKTLAKTLGSSLPICGSCKKIREDDGSWKQIEDYISDHSETEFSHGLCPECIKLLYPDLSLEP
jgi:CRP-like cAMP-binding protein